jgi:hypothetical protein
VQIHHFDAIIFARDLRGAVVVIAIVGHDNDPVRLARLGQDTFDGGGNVILLVMRRNQDGDSCTIWISTSTLYLNGA